MVLKKQTVWLLSMLTILVVLSAYYLVQGPTKQVPVVSKDKQDSVPADMNFGATVKTKQTSVDKGPAPTQTDDYFISFKMNRDAEQSQEMDQFLQVMQSSSAQPTAIAQAKKKYEELAALQDMQNQVEELIKSTGHYKDAIVIAKDDMVHVIVQAKSLPKNKAVDIIGLVNQQMKVPSNNIIVSYKP
ncbi:SpoIIIAH-like family protein [Aneurinibacillus terranovensis]|uniref:SpoIIIAH-like family protein n=1 Tax=Aneurinibacillus terranovensis TaxID=278991 RepID=UPI00041CD5AD|nr:SpoIIIAH-like family protein [Aneurinibacillus terranovensis]